MKRIFQMGNKQTSDGDFVKILRRILEIADNKYLVPAMKVDRIKELTLGQIEKINLKSL